MIKEYKDIFIAIIIALILFGLAYTIFDIRQSILVGTVAFLVTLWTNEALPLGVVSILPIILFPTFGILDIDETTRNYSKSIIFLFLGGFMLAIAIEKTRLHEYFSNRLLSLFPKTPTGVYIRLSYHISPT